MAGDQGQPHCSGCARHGDLSDGDADVHDYGREGYILPAGKGGCRCGECKGAEVGDDHAWFSREAAAIGAGAVVGGDGSRLQPGRSGRLIKGLIKGTSLFTEAWQPCTLFGYSIRYVF